MNKTKVITSLCLNALIVALTIIGAGIAVIDCQKQGVDYWMMLIYYTTLSNFFLCIASVIYVIYQAQLLAGKIKKLPNWVNVLKMCAASTTTLTMLVVILFLTPTMAMSSDPDAMPVLFLFTGSNLIFHLFNPLLGIISFLLFEHSDDLTFGNNWYSLIFTGLYEAFYTLDIFYQFIPLMGKQAKHDWYGFLTIVNGNVDLIPIVLAIFLGFTFLLCWLLWLGNKKINVFKNKKTTATK